MLQRVEKGGVAKAKRSTARCPEPIPAGACVVLGPAKPRRVHAPIAASLDDLVPAGHFSRHLEATLDLGFVGDWTRTLSADRGRPGIDPVVFFKRQLMMFVAGIRSERRLIETASLNLAHRWDLGSALDEPLPDHSSLTRIRRRLGVGVFARFFARVVDRCQEAGLVWGRERSVDATKVQADADIDTLVPRFAHDARTRLAEVFADGPTIAASEVDEGVPTGLLRRPLPATGDGQGSGRWALREERRLDPDRPTDEDERLSKWRVRPTDPDATPMRTGAGAGLGDHDHDVVDGGTARIILAALVTPADVMENVPRRDLLWRVCFRRTLRPRQVTGDPHRRHRREHRRD